MCLGVPFDESQMFSLLGVAVERLDHAVKALMANGFLNLLHFRDDEEGNARCARRSSTRSYATPLNSATALS